MGCRSGWSASTKRWISRLLDDLVAARHEAPVREASCLEMSADGLLTLAQTAQFGFFVCFDGAGAVILMVLGYLVFMAVGLAISGWIRDPQRAGAVAQSIAFPMIFLALLTAALPPGISGVTKYLPVSYITDGMQQLGQGAKLGSIVWDLA